MTSPEILLNRENLFHNADYYLSKGKKLFAVIKDSNAYGHGSVEIAKALEEKYSTEQLPYFCLARQSEVEFLRNQKILRPCLIFSDWLVAKENMWPDNCVPVVQSFDDVKMITSSNANLQKIHLKINTGMNRLGFSPEDLNLLEKSIESLSHKSIIIEGIMSHLAKAEFQDDEFSKLQEIQFLRVKKQLLEKWKPQWGPKPVYFHLANSEGYLHEVGTQKEFNAVRIGLGLWGVQEKLGMKNKNIHLKPVMKLRAPIRKIFEVKAGEGVGYAHAFVAQKRMKLATVNLGYADGLRRDLATDNRNLGLDFKGKTLPICGRISMDLCTLDASGVDCREGDWVYWINEKFSTEYWADIMKTISYEVFCSMNARIKRVWDEDPRC